MAFRDKFEAFAKTAYDKTGEAVEYTKLNAKMLDVQNKLDKAYIQMAKRYLELHPANEEEEMKTVVEAVYAMEDQLNDLRGQLQNLKGTAKCHVCGFQCPAEAAFCSKCGTELKKEEFIFEAEEVFEEDLEEDAE